MPKPPPSKGTTRPSGTIAKAASPSSSPAVKKLADAVKKANAVPSGIRPAQSTNNLFAYSYTKPFYAPVPKTNIKPPSGKKTVGSGEDPGGIPGAASPPSPPPPDMFEGYTPPPPPPVRVPERDVVNLVTEGVDSQTIQNLLFENVGANELTKFVRHDTVEGINPYYDIISNLSDIKRKFDTSNIISLQKNNSSFFDIYPIKLQDKIPSDTYLQENNLDNYIYIDTNGDLVIEVVNMRDPELIEVEIDTNGTIYEVDET
jgi:hypothetical protein